MASNKNMPVVLESPKGVTTESMGNGGGLEGASRTTRDTALWTPAMGSPNSIINRGKKLADARGRDMFNNDGYTHGAIATYKDSIVGGQFKLNIIPNLRVLQAVTGAAFDEDWAIEMQQVGEAFFEALAESEDNWLDVAGVLNFTGLARLAVASDAMTGEILSLGHWLNKDRSRPINTAVQLLAPSRLENEFGMPDGGGWSRGVRENKAGKPLEYCFRNFYAGETSDDYSWTKVEARKPWGRRQVIHLFDKNEPDQTRGIADIVAALKSQRMTKQLDDLTLQNAVVNASVAYSLESELPPDVVYGTMGAGGGPENFQAALYTYLQMIGTYFDQANNVAVDGVMAPVLPPGVKMNARSLATPGGVSGEYGNSLLRHTCAALGISFEEFSRNYAGVSYSGLKGAFASTERSMKARKKRGADRFANNVWALVLEELIGKGWIPLPRGVSREVFYVPLVKDAICRADWIGAGRGQIDEYKETQAAALRVEKGLSTRRQEIARLGGDYRETFKQLAREKQEAEDLGLDFSAVAANAANDPEDNADEPKNGNKDK
jgi:lambda family phage portal protein